MYMHINVHVPCFLLLLVMERVMPSSIEAEDIGGRRPYHEEGSNLLPSPNFTKYEVNIITSITIFWRSQEVYSFTND